MFKTILSQNQFTIVKTKLLIYTALLNPIWTYGLQLWARQKNRILTTFKYTGISLFAKSQTLYLTFLTKPFPMTYIRKQLTKNPILVLKTVKIDA